MVVANQCNCNCYELGHLIGGTIGVIVSVLVRPC